MRGKSYTDISREDFECGKFKKIKTDESNSGEKDRDVVCGASVISDR